MLASFFLFSYSDGINKLSLIRADTMRRPSSHLTIDLIVHGCDCSLRLMRVAAPFVNIQLDEGKNIFGDFSRHM